MKMKLAVAFAVLLVATLARADSTQITVDVTATGCPQCPQQFAPVNLQAQFTVEQVAGTFFDSGFAYTFTGTVDEVIAISGTLNGNQMTLAAAPYGDGSWLYEDGNGAFQLGTVYFNDGAYSGWLENDGYSLLEGGGVGSGNTGIEWAAFDPPVGAPEPTTGAMLIAGLLGLLATSRHRRETEQRPDC
jgi:hypothetical protein